MPLPGGKGVSEGPIRTLFTFDEATGGTFNLDRYTLGFEPGFIDNVDGGPVGVTLTIPDPSIVMLDLTIAPSEWNSFEDVVVVTISLAGTGVSPKDVLGLWYNKQTGLWEQVSLNYSEEGNTVSLELKHFSRYALANSN
ncbi:MAG: hypothetical protein QME66_13220 [Candidatus Eisenbacteria bacterium]|nr:hypothetical protein [Candidatus Eisenbacteria bacterium]